MNHIGVVITMRGDRVVVLRPISTGIDSHGNEVYEDEREPVDNVLIRPNLGDTNATPHQTPYATNLTVTFAFPKNYSRSLRNCHVYVPSYDRTFLIVDDPLPTHGAPTAWHLLAKGVCIDGA